MTPDTIQIVSGDGSATASFVPAAGLLCCSLRHQGEELLDQGRGVEAYTERGKTMGVPLLYPWANRLAEYGYAVGDRRVTLPHDPLEIPPDENGLPIHGVIPGLMRWHATGADAATLNGRLEWSSEVLLRLFPFVHEARIEARIGAGSLTITTTVRATGQDTVPVSFGFHPYLRTPAGPREELQVELPVGERLLSDELSIPTGAREPLGPTTFPLADTSWDDGLVLTGDGPARFAISGTDRMIALDLLEGFPYAQIYAPAGRDFICFEPMTAPTNALRSGDGLTLVQPGEEYRAAFRISW